MIRKIVAALSRTARGTLGAGRVIARLLNADTALFVGWAMVAVGCGLVSLPAGLIVGGLFLIGGALFVARGSE